MNYEAFSSFKFGMQEIKAYIWQHMVKLLNKCNYPNYTFVILLAIYKVVIEVAWL